MTRGGSGWLLLLPAGLSPATFRQLAWRSQQHSRLRAGTFLKGDVVRIADGVPDPIAVDLAVEEVAFATRRQDPDTEALDLGIANVISFSVRREVIDPALCETTCRYVSLSVLCCTGDTETSCFRAIGTG